MLCQNNQMPHCPCLQVSAHIELQSRDVGVVLVQLCLVSCPPHFIVLAVTTRFYSQESVEFTHRTYPDKMVTRVLFFAE